MRRCRRWKVMGAVGVLAWILVSIPEAGAEALKWRQVQSITKVKVIEIGDVPDHIIGLYGVPGLAFLENGEVAALWLAGTLDYVEGAGTHRGYATLTFDDQSKLVYHFQGTTRLDESGKISLLDGKIVFVEGGGRFAGIQGEGTYTGRRAVPFGLEAFVYVDFTSYRLPGR